MSLWCRTFWEAIAWFLWVGVFVMAGWGVVCMIGG